MSLQVTCNPAELSREQREAVAGFILAFPTACAGTCHNKPAPAIVAPIAAAIAAAIAAEPTKLHDEAGYELPPFGDTIVDPAVAFGGAVAPLPPGAPAAPFTAGAAPSTTAPAAPPATSTAPTAPVPPAATPANSGAPAAPNTANPAEVDSAGLPWDSRIHAGSKAKIANGTWRKKQQLDPAFLAGVEAELRALMSTPSPAPSAAPATAPMTLPAASSGAHVPPPPSAPPASGAAGVTLAAPNGAPIEPTRDAYVALVGRASAALQANKVSQAELTGICAAAGVAALPLLVSRLDLLPGVAAQIDALIASRG